MTKTPTRKTSAKRPRRAKPKPRDPALISAKLDAIEAEMKRIGFWGPPSEEPKDGNYQEAPFKAWLQFAFLPAARAATEKRKWPSRSQVGLMALRNYDYHGTVEEALPLVRLLNEFDDLIEHPERAAGQHTPSS